MGAGGSIQTFSGREDLLSELHAVASQNLPQLLIDAAAIGLDVDAINIEAKLPQLIDQHPALLTNLCIKLARQRNINVSTVILDAIRTSCSVNVCDVIPINTLHLDLPIDQAATMIKMFMESHKLNNPSAISAECQESTSLDCLQPYLKNKQFMLSSINVANNQLDAEAVKSCNLKQSESLLQLIIGGNPFESMTQVVSYIPSSLIVLDVSYTEGLVFSPGVFLTCPQLLHLCLDGCGLTSTSFDPIEDEDNNTSALAIECSKSIFFGLVSLISLSMKENAFEDADSLRGLKYFSLATNNDEKKTTTEKSAATLRHVCLADNPLCEISADHKAATAFIVANIPSIHTIDDKVVHTTATSKSVDRSSAEFRKQHAHDQKLRENERGMNLVSDAMEREFTATIMGEKDNAVVS